MTAKVVLRPPYTHAHAPTRYSCTKRWRQNGKEMERLAKCILRGTGFAQDITEFSVPAKARQ